MVEENIEEINNKNINDKSICKCKNENEVIQDVKHELSLCKIFLLYFVFIIGWTLRVKFLQLENLPELCAWTINFIFYIIWWPGFALFFIKRYDNSLNISFKEMLFTKPRLKVLLILIAFAILYNTGTYFVSGMHFGINMKLYDFIITVLSVGFFEEIVFRGWFLNSLMKYMNGKYANIVSSILFVLIHYPGWIIGGYSFILILETSILIFILSLLFGWIFRKYKSIWNIAIFHSLWDMLSFLVS